MPIKARVGIRSRAADEICVLVEAGGEVVGEHVGAAVGLGLDGSVGWRLVVRMLVLLGLRWRMGL